MPNNCGFLSYRDIFKHEKFNISHLVDHIHLDPAAQQIVASHMMQWLDKSSDPIVGKMSEGGTLGALSETLRADGRIVNIKANIEEEEEEIEEIKDEVFDGSAQAYVKEARRLREEKAAADAAAAAAQAAANPPGNSGQPHGVQQDANAVGGGAPMSTTE